MKRTLAEIREQRARDMYGCTYAEMCEINREDGSYKPSFAFYAQRYSAIVRRGIGWELTLPQWWAIWRESGKWNGRRPGGYVMCRHGDTGPYAVGNVRIATSSENVREYHARRAAA